jgi:putative toxin-antitoxin system antitoxin component (TIGR02293 family)
MADKIMPNERTRRMSKPQRARAGAGPRPRKEARTPDIASHHDLVREGRGGPHAYATLLGLEAQGGLELLGRVEAGLGYETVERFQRNAGLTLQELAAFVAIKPRTLLRRREEGQLHPDESDRLLRASRVFARALELFDGDAAAARRWLAAPALALGGRSPREVASTDMGAREVEDLAGRLEHGVFS